jgi:UDP-galactopyranose mutase
MSSPHGAHQHLPSCYRCHRAQWGHHPSELGPEVTARIPLRTNFDDRYFNDRYQALLLHGYTSFFASLLRHPNITIALSTDFHEVAAAVRLQAVPKPVPLFYTGPIDRYFKSAGLGDLEYRSLRFSYHLYPDVHLMQTASVVNQPSEMVEVTRCVGYKHLRASAPQDSPHSVVVCEYPSDKGEPYYPVPSTDNKALFARYQELATRAWGEQGVYFVGRLANYKYINMDQAVDFALKAFESYASNVGPAASTAR